MMYLYPELIDQSKGIDEVPKQKDLFPEIIKYSRYSTKTESGVIGYPTAATSQKGEVLVQRSVDRIVQFLHEAWDIPHS